MDDVPWREGGLVDTLGRKRGARSTPAPPSPPKTITPPLWRGWNHQRRPGVDPNGRPFFSSSLSLFSFLFLSFFLFFFLWTSRRGRDSSHTLLPSPSWTRILRVPCFCFPVSRRGWDRGRAKMRVGTGLLKFWSWILVGKGRGHRSGSFPPILGEMGRWDFSARLLFELGIINYSLR